MKTTEKTMIGKTLYKAKIRDGQIVMESNTIVLSGTKLYHFDKERKRGCHKEFVGVVCFLTKKEAIDRLIKNLEHSIECGEKYLKKTREQLADSIVFLEK